jgi:TatD DNase family protein
LIDTHCHLGHGDADPEQLIARARENGVVGFVDVGIDAATSLAAQARSRKFDEVRFTAGIHPCDADRLDEDWATVEDCAADPRCVAVGETGFDFHWDRSTPARQRESFERHLELARALGKPTVVHCREAFSATFEVLAAHRDVRAVLHCFAGGVDEARRALDLGCMLSFAGPLTYPRADELRAAAAFAPEDRILVETDAPFLPPQGYRGQRNEPARVRDVLVALAQLRSVTEEDLATATTTNARRTFVGV